MKNQFYGVLGTPNAGELANFVKLMIANEWSVDFKLGGWNGTANDYNTFWKFKGAFLPNGSYREIQSSDFRGTTGMFGSLAYGYYGQIEIEGSPQIDGDGIVGYATVGDVVALVNNASGYSTDLKDVYEIAFANASGTIMWLVVGVSEVDQTDFYTPFNQSSVQAVAYLDRAYVNSLKKVGDAVSSGRLNEVKKVVGNVRQMGPGMIKLNR